MHRSLKVFFLLEVSLWIPRPILYIIFFFSITMFRSADCLSFFPFPLNRHLLAFSPLNGGCIPSIFRVFAPLPYQASGLTCVPLPSQFSSISTKAFPSSPDPARLTVPGNNLKLEESRSLFYSPFSFSPHTHLAGPGTAPPFSPNEIGVKRISKPPGLTRLPVLSCFRCGFGIAQRSADSVSGV